MIVEPNSVVAPLPGEDVRYPVQILETRPESITWHIIWDHELQNLTNIARPIILGLSTAFLGCFVGLIPLSIDVLDRIDSNKSISVGDVAAVVAAGISFAFFSAFGFFALRGQRDAWNIKETIRNRRPSQVMPPH